MKLTAENVKKIFMNCLYNNGENTKNRILAEGVMMKVGFHPERLKEAEPEIMQLLNELPDAFFSEGGGGWSFLNMCEDKHGNLWGQHCNVDQLVCLGLGIDKLRFVMPREFWSVFPGGMPYLVSKG